jgi:hypothetical protein
MPNSPTYDVLVNHNLWKDGFLVVNNVGKLILGGHQYVLCHY